MATVIDYWASEEAFRYFMSMLCGAGTSDFCLIWERIDRAYQMGRLSDSQYGNLRSEFDRIRESIRPSDRNTAETQLPPHRQAQLGVLRVAFEDLRKFGVSLPDGAAEKQARAALEAIIGLDEGQPETSLQLPLEAETTTLNIRIGSK